MDYSLLEEPIEAFIQRMEEEEKMEKQLSDKTEEEYFFRVFEATNTYPS
jgi:hypothetical protein